MLRNRQKGEGSMRRKNGVWGGNDAHRIIRTTLRYLPQMSHHKFSPHQTGVVLHLYHNIKHKHGPRAPLAGISG